MCNRWDGANRCVTIDTAQRKRNTSDAEHFSSACHKKDARTKNINESNVNSLWRLATSAIYCVYVHHYNNIITVSIKIAYIIRAMTPVTTATACMQFLSPSSLATNIRYNAQIERIQCHAGVDCCCLILNIDSNHCMRCLRWQFVALRKIFGCAGFIWPKNLWA